VSEFVWIYGMEYGFCAVIRFDWRTPGLQLAVLLRPADRAQAAKGEWE
jgi:hypothetical protein